MPLIDYANPLNSQGLQQLAGPFGSLLGPGATFPSSYDFAKRFVNNAKTAEGSGGNGVTALDDPTYLGFQLMFDPFSPLFNGAGVGETEPSATDEPGSDGQGTLGSLASQFGIPNTFIEPAQGTFEGTSSAVGYLTKIGEGSRALYLKAFIQGIQEINRTRPYYWQTIEGLEDAWTKATDFSLDPFTGSAKDAGITIGCLEAIDLKLTALFTLYKMAVYDVQYKRFVLPKNLMRFNVYVYVQEIRKFKTVRNWITTFDPSNNGAETANFVNENTSQVGFKFSECMWDMSASGAVFSTVTNSGGEIATTSMKFGYSNIEQQSQFSGYSSALKDWTQQGTSKPSIGATIKKFAKDQLANQAAGAINKLQRTVSNAIQGFTLGNVFGKRNSIFSTIQNPQALANALSGAAIQNGDTIDAFSTQGGAMRLGDNPLGEGVQPGTTLTGDTRIFPDSPTPANFPSERLFKSEAPGPPFSSTNIFE